MRLEDIIAMYGKHDYMDMNCPGRIYKLSEMTYDKEKDTTAVPVVEDGNYLGDCLLKGDYT